MKCFPVCLQSNNVGKPYMELQVEFDLRPFSGWKRFNLCKEIKDCLGFRIPGTEWIPVLCQWKLDSDSIRWWDSGFLELYSVFQRPKSGFHKQNFTATVSGFGYMQRNVTNLEVVTYCGLRPKIGHFLVPKSLTFKMRLGAQPFLWKWVLFAWEWKMISISKAEHLSSFWNRGPGELGNGLLQFRIEFILSDVIFHFYVGWQCKSICGGKVDGFWLFRRSCLGWRREGTLYVTQCIYSRLSLNGHL